MSLIPLLEGQTFPNYKALCEYLGEDIKTSCSKQAQLEVWKTLFSWKTDGHKWIILNNTSVEIDPALRPELFKVSKLKRAFLQDKGVAGLSVGQKFPTYIDLCHALQEAPLPGASKKAQLERWSDYFEWAVAGHSWTITKVLRPWEPLDPMWKYSKFTEACKLLLSYFVEQAKEVPKRADVVLTKANDAGSILELTLVSRSLYRILGFHGEDWSLLQEEEAWLVPVDRVPFHKAVRDAIKQAGKEVFREELISVLDSLAKRKLLMVHKVFYVGEAVDKTKTKVRLTSVEEQTRILLCKEQALEDIKAKHKDEKLNEYSLHAKGLAREFYDLWLAYVQNWYNLESIYPAITLQAGKSMQQNITAYLLELEQKATYRRAHNKKLQPKITNRASSVLAFNRGWPVCTEDMSWLADIVPVVMTLS